MSATWSSPPSIVKMSATWTAFVLLLLLPHLLHGVDCAVTAPEEVSLLKVLAQKLGVATMWDFKSDPCGSDFQPKTGNNYGGSSLQCDCSYENGTLCHITAIAIYRMNLNSALPAELAGLKYLTFLDLNGNNLNGVIPKGLGSLRNLTHLGLGTNQLTGGIPSELGNLELLIDLYLDSNELTGSIPSSFKSLRNLNNLWIFNNKLTGSIPDIFDNLTSLIDLRLYGNYQQGPIPSSIKALKGLIYMYIGDIHLGGSIPSGLISLANLTELSFRNCGLSGDISSELGGMKALTYLDLRFNSLGGSIPAELGKLDSLQTLYLGSNNLMGNIPDLSRLRNLKYLDISYNNLTGPLPQWLSQSSMNVDLVSNSFDMGSSMLLDKQKYLPYTLNCLDSQTTCNQSNPGLYKHFSINIGGPAYRSSELIFFEQENETLSYSSLFINSQKTWGVSQGGGMGQSNFLDTANTTEDIQGTVDPTLYQTARSSPSSLKFYGLSMINGVYIVELHFAEIVLANGALGKRVFDVYIQRKQVLKDFDIQASANGSFKALIQKFQAEVSDKYLEINFMWSGRGTCCYPRRWSYGPLIAAINVYPGELYQVTSKSSKKKIMIASFIAGVSGILILIILVLTWYKMVARRNAMPDDKGHHIKDKVIGLDAQHNLEIDAKVDLFPYNDLYSATGGFNPCNKLGEGGFGVVHKGTLMDGSVVAVKELSAKSNQGDTEFLNEVAVISAVQHRNLVKLRGCCLEGNRRLLVYEYLENNSLAQILFDRNLNLDWTTRFNIALGTARGLAYLHEESQTRIIHRDIKASNILLDRNFKPKIADFGLARLFEDGKTHISTRIAGTLGYMAPEYALRGQLSEKADVFSYGMVILELVSGRRNVDLNLPEKQRYLMDVVWQFYEEKCLLDIVDHKLQGNFPTEDASRIIQVALLCTQHVASARPSMPRVVAMLSGDAAILPVSFIPLSMTDMGNFSILDRTIITSSSSSQNTTTITEIEPR